MKKWLLIKDEGNPAAGCLNAFFVTLVIALAVLVAINVVRWYVSPAPAVEEAASEGEPSETAFERADELSEQLRTSECLILLPPGVSEEPDYRLGRGDECDQQ